MANDSNDNRCIEFRFLDNGEFEAEALGYEGPQCVADTHELGDATGGEKVREYLTSDYEKSSSSQQDYRQSTDTSL